MNVESIFRPTRVEISLDALEHNLKQFRRILPTQVDMMAVVKADAYGHGAVKIAQEALRCGVSYLAVAFLDEALELREAGITAPILVLGYTPPEAIRIAADQAVTLNVYTDDVLEALEQRDSDEPPLQVHVKLDTGMGRIGLHREKDALDFIQRAMQLPNVTVEGLFTHYASADESDKSYTVEQHRRFDRVVSHFGERGIHFRFLHAGNSATAIDCPELTYNMVRLGISMYGLYPSSDVQKHRISLQPLMSIKSNIVMVKTVPPGTGISYGTIYHTTGEETIGTLPIGYADGFSRMLTGQAHALIHGCKVPVVGKICMDQCMINVTAVPDVHLRDEVVLLGRQGNEEITADDLAAILGTISYEITCMVSRRVPRIYYRGGQAVDSTNRLLTPKNIFPSTNFLD